MYMRSAQSYSHMHIVVDVLTSKIPSTAMSHVYHQHSVQNVVAMVTAQCDMYLCLMVDICLCSNQMFYNWKMSILAGDVHWCRTILEVKNSLEVAP